MSDEFIQRIRTVIANSQRIPIEKVLIDSSFQELGIDSMDAVNILFGLESEFDINIPDDEVKDIRTIRQMAEGVEKLLVAKAAGSAAAGPAPAQ
jgi:acyl carrier protein